MTLMIDIGIGILIMLVLVGILSLFGGREEPAGRGYFRTHGSIIETSDPREDRGLQEDLYYSGTGYGTWDGDQTTVRAKSPAAAAAAEAARTVRMCRGRAGHSVVEDAQAFVFWYEGNPEAGTKQPGHAPIRERQERWRKFRGE